MPDYIFLMHNDAPILGGEVRNDNWASYIRKLQSTGRFQGGSAIGAGVCVRKRGTAPAITAQLSGFIRVTAASLDDAATMLLGNPVFEAGGTVEIRELPRSD